MDSTAYWLMFFAAALAINLSPGPDMIYILSKTVTGGKKNGFAASAGVCTGALVHVFAAALGLSAILATSALAFSIVKYAGAAYLVYLAVQSFRPGMDSFEFSDNSPQKSPWSTFRQGILIDILNPKVAVFFMAFLPQFIRPGAGSTSQQIIILGIMVIAVAVITEFFIVMAASCTTGLLRKNKKYSLIMNRMQGSILMALAFRLALTEQKNN